MYTAYVLEEEARASLLEMFPPKYNKTIAHHITLEFGVGEATAIPEDAEIAIIGHVDNHDGLEALVVTVDGTAARPDGGYYHITWSLNPLRYKPVDSNKLVKHLPWKYQEVINICTIPKLLK